MVEVQRTNLPEGTAFAGTEPAAQENRTDVIANLVLCGWRHLHGEKGVKICGRVA